MQTFLLDNGVGLWDRTETLSSDAALAQRRRSTIFALSVYDELPSVREESKREGNLFSLHEKTFNSQFDFMHMTLLPRKPHLIRR
jgi:hypothetical protein